MADNIELDPGTGGATVATDDVGGVQFQKVKLDVGGDGVSAPVSNSNPVPVSDAGGTLTVDGTVAVTNAGLTELAAAINASSQMDVNIAASGATVPVSNAGLTELAAAINASSQMDVNVAAGTLAVTNAGTFAVQNTAQASTNTQEMVGDAAHDAAAAGNPLLQGAYASAAAPADVSADGDAVRLWALRNGSQVVNIAAAGALIGATSNALDVNIKSGASSGTQYTEDAAAAADPVGTAVILVRDDTPGALVSADGDNVAQRGTNYGAAFCQIVDSSGNFVDTFGGSGGTAAADDADFTATTTQGTPAMGVYESTPTSVTDNDMGIVGITQTRAMKVAIDSGGITGRAEDAQHASGHEGVVLLGVRRDAAAVGSDTDGDYSTINVDSTGRLWCNVSNTVTVASHAVTNAGTFAVQAASAGVAADDAATSGNPVLVAGVAVETDGTDPTTVSAEGDAAYLRTDRSRNLLVNITHPRFWHVSADYGAAQTNASVKAAPGASLSLYITDLVISNGATAGNVTLLDGSGGTVLFEIYPAINGGATLSLRNPIKLTANTALCITSTTVTTHSIFVAGYIAP